MGRIKKVYSHTHAIAQCHKFLHHTLKDAAAEGVTSTAAAAQFCHGTSRLANWRNCQ